MEGNLMRFLILLLSVALTWQAFSEAAAAGPRAALIKTREGSLVLEGSESKVPGATQKDLLHTMLSREVQVYIFRSSNRAWPQPYVLGKTRFYRPGGGQPKLAGPYLEKLIQKYAHHYGVDPSLVRAVMRHESGFNPQAVSPKGAQGLMQLMPGTAALMGVENPFDPEQNIAGGVGYLRLCLDRFGQSLPLAVAAYNAGPGRVAQSRGVPQIPETQNFVKNVLGTYTGQPAPALTTAKLSNSPPDQPRAKMTTRPSSRKMLATPARAGSPANQVKITHRPRAKVIEVRYPQIKRLAARPRGAE
jgi:hypothetical protein